MHSPKHGTGARDRSEPIPRLYGELASWWPLLSDPADYEEEAAFFASLLNPEPSEKKPTLLELGSGGGNNAYHLKSGFQVTLTDLSPEMLVVSRRINPECEHVSADMRTLRLHRSFDAVFVHDAIMYMTTAGDLTSAVRTAAIHCRSGGRAVFAPDHTVESFEPRTCHGGHDAGKRGMRFLEWHWDSDPDDETTECVFSYVLRSEDGSLRHEFDRHTFGLFGRNTWMAILQEEGFETEILRDPWGRDIFLGLKT